MRLKDKVAIVTGTSSNIGIGIAEAFAEEGAKVVGVARRTQEGESVMQAIRDRGGEAIFVQADVADENDVTVKDDTVRPDGRGCSLRAWSPGLPTDGPTDLELLLTEFADPGGVATYFLMPGETEADDDELIQLRRKP